MLPIRPLLIQLPRTPRPRTWCGSTWSGMSQAFLKIKGRRRGNSACEIPTIALAWRLNPQNPGHAWYRPSHCSRGDLMPCHSPGWIEPWIVPRTGKHFKGQESASAAILHVCCPTIHARVTKSLDRDEKEQRRIFSYNVIIHSVFTSSCLWLRLRLHWSGSIH